MLDRLPPAYLRIAEKACGRKFTSDTDLISALEDNTFPKRAEFLTIMTNSLGYEFTSPLEVFRLASGERLAEFEPLSPPPGAPSPLQIAGKTFGRTFPTPKDLFDFLDEVPKREMKYQASLIAAGWRAKKKTPTRRIALEKADQLFSAFVERIPTANSNRNFAFFVQEVLVYGSYLRRQSTVGDIDIAMQFALKTDAKLRERISFYLRKGTAVDWKEGYGLAISEVSNFLTKRSKYFHDADSATVKRSYPYELVYAMPELQEYVRLVDQTANSPSVEHLHRFLEQAERRKSKQRRALTPATKLARKPRRT
jgi:predicted nucleotidyltransferase